MSDFLYSNVPCSPGHLSAALRSIHLSREPEIDEFHGSWGSLAVSGGLYRGYRPLETNSHIAAILGGPVLWFRANDVYSGESASVATSVILKRWISCQMNWDRDISGPFVALLIDKNRNRVTCVTDTMMFIPVYRYSHGRRFFLGSHVDALAVASAQEGELDHVSIADFILHNVVTYPFTLYSKIRQCTPATEHVYELESRRGYDYWESTYWMPYERVGFACIEEAADELRSGLADYVSRVTENTQDVAQFLSAGEDSRAVAGMLPSNIKHDAFIFLDGFNREGRIAAQLAHAYNARLTVGYRGESHYLDILEEASRLIGGGYQYTHAHSIGFDRSLNLNAFDAVFGGYMADALLKAVYRRSFRGQSRIPFGSLVCIHGEDRSQPIRSSLFPSDVTSEITERRRNHIKTIEQYRPKSVHEWFVLWPASMRTTNPYFACNRRLLRIYEPFMSNRVVKVAASVPVEWKIDRRLYRMATLPLLAPSKWIRHSDGHIPYCSALINEPVYFVTNNVRSLMKRLGVSSMKDGPWCDWNALTGSVAWDTYERRIVSRGEALTSVFSSESDIRDLMRSRMTLRQRINTLQIAYWMTCDF